MPFVPLNAFQQVMRLWDAVAPYNAVQAFELKAELDAAHLNACWRRTLKTLGIGRAIIRAQHYALVVPNDNDSRADVEVASIDQTLPALLSAEMNRNWPGAGDDREADECPFHAFTWRDPARGATFAGVTYHHWVADSFSIRRLLREWYLRIIRSDQAGTAPAKLPRFGLWRGFGPAAGAWHLDEGLLEMFRSVTRFARARQCHRPMGSCAVKVSVQALPEGIVSKLLATARRHHATVNDLLVAALGRAVDQFGANPSTPDRDELALSTVADLRGSSRRPIDDLFGLFLGFTTTMLRPDDLADFSRLLRTVSRQNAYSKRTAAAQSSMLRIAFGLAESRFTTPRRWAEKYRAKMPLAAAISNVNLNRDWPARFTPGAIQNYIRATPTGPMIPLTFTPTTLGDNMNFLLTVQQELIDAQRAQALADSIVKQLGALVQLQ